MDGGSGWGCSTAGCRIRAAGAGVPRAKAPIPAIDFIDTAKGEKLLVTGSWDRAIRVYRIKDAQLVAEVKDASADFIKAIHVFCSAGRTWIAAAGSDKSIMLYDATPLTTSTSGQAELKCVHKYAVHTRPINALASLTALDGTTHLYSADSMGRIIESIVSPSLRLEPVREMVGFSTAVYSIHATGHVYRKTPPAARMCG